MRIEQLEYLQAVTRLGSLRRAAEELHLSQPALSETVRNLERELGVDLLERRRSGAKISEKGRELLPYMESVLEAVDRLRRAADEQHRTSRVVRLGTVNAATVPLVIPVVRAFRGLHPMTQVEVVGAQQTDIHRGIREGSFDLGLVNYLRGDDPPPDFTTTELLSGPAVVCLRPSDPLAARPVVEVADLLRAPLIMMRSGYIMHRLVHRLLGGAPPSFSYSTDGAEMGKLMVAEGLGVTVLPEFSVVDDPLLRGGLITYRPLAPPVPEVLLVIQSQLSGPSPRAVRDLRRLFADHAAALGEGGGRGRREVRPTSAA